AQHHILKVKTESTIISKTPQNRSAFPISSHRRHTLLTPPPHSPHIAAAPQSSSHRAPSLSRLLLPSIPFSGRLFTFASRGRVAVMKRRRWWMIDVAEMLDRYGYDSSLLLLSKMTLSSVEVVRGVLDHASVAGSVRD
ncbi:hypothetical protein Drorol1_Dr00010963, partial [Drosera rotundifolia]